jgi:periplasmic protein CpxP/Spy
MNIRSLLVLGAVSSILIPLSNHIAVAQNNQSSIIRQQPRLIAQEPPEGGRGYGSKQRKDFMKDLNLSSEQQTKIKAIRDQNKQDTQGLREQLKTLHQQMKSLGVNSTDDQLRQQHEQVKNLRQQLEDKRFEEMLAIRKVLTPEQRAKLAQKMPRKNQPQR